jgi:hypothetical protein
MDASGAASTPFVTHADRRNVAQARRLGREHLLSAVLEGLAAGSAARVPRLAAVATPQPVGYVTGGAAVDVLYRDRPPGGGAGERRALPADATLSGVSVLADRAR